MELVTYHAVVYNNSADRKRIKLFVLLSRNAVTHHVFAVVTGLYPTFEKIPHITDVFLYPWLFGHMSSDLTYQNVTFLFLDSYRGPNSE
jgi:hypothetical protein